MEENIYKLSTLPVTENVSGDIRAILAEARQRAARIVNHTMVTAYWLIGRRIVLEEQANSSKAAYGEEVLQNLSRELTTEFGNGFSYSNLRNMRQFYRTYPDPEKCYTVCSKLSWSHNRLIMRVADADARVKNCPSFAKRGERSGGSSRNAAAYAGDNFNQVLVA